LSLPEALEHLRAGRPQAAAAILAAFVAGNPTDAGAWFLLGASHHALNDLPAAAEAFARSLRIDPSNAEAHFAHVSVLRGMGHKHAALEASKKAIGRFPSDPRVLFAVALCFEDVGDDQSALAHYDAALAAAPMSTDVLHNRTLLLARLGRLEDAYQNQLAYVAAQPHEARAQLGLADACLALGNFDEALTATEAAERLSPGDIGALLRRGAACASLRRFDEARFCFAKARAIDEAAVSAFVQRITPGSRMDLMLSPENLFFWQCHLAFQRCDWRSWQGCVEEMKRLPSKPGVRVEPAVAFIAFHLVLTGSERLAIARHVAREIEASAPALPPPPKTARKRIRVGILSPDFREHLNAYLLLPLFELLDREHFEIFAYSLAPDDGSRARAAIAASADSFRELQAQTDEEAAALIRADQVDILIDAAGHTTGGRFDITARRPAPAQVLYLGFAGSLGSERVDYAIIDQVVWGTQEEWAESPVRLPHTYYLYDFREPVPDVTVSRHDYGLTEDQFVFCAFHKAEKISPDAFAVWMRILASVPEAVLWHLSLPPAAQRNLRTESEKLGVDPRRLIFAPFDPRDRYLARQRLGDLMLDTFHHSAMTTACDAMAAGLPVLTLRGDAMASRAGASLARAAGVPELVAASAQDYAEKAIALASNRMELRRLRNVLLSRGGALFDTPGRVREIEKALASIYDTRR
jgi:predicted O-linked N-acetylglucosamine transferase (SPINDLY family)